MDHNRLSDYLSPGGDDRPAPPRNVAALPLGLQGDANTPDLYALAWTQSLRDHELDRLFNAAFYYEI